MHGEWHIGDGHDMTVVLLLTATIVECLHFSGEKNIAVGERRLGFSISIKRLLSRICCFIRELHCIVGQCIN